ncbi:MAG: hypothetical protein LBK74_09515 [Treponema sp.]|jgi:hypothetical protein|nr:hypothetical protein [Treponema sp.]
MRTVCGLLLVWILGFSLTRAAAQEEPFPAAEPVPGDEENYDGRQDYESDYERKPLIPNDNFIFGQPEFLDIDMGLDAGFERGFWMGLGLKFNYTGGPFTVTADLVFKNDQKYAPAAVMLPSGSLGGFYFLLNEGGVTYSKDFFYLRGGRFKNYDEVDSPYSLFLNSSGISANTLKLRLESDHFIYQTQWIELNRDSGVSSPGWNEYRRRTDHLNPSTGYNAADPSTQSDTTNLSGYGFPDRGVNYKIYGIKINDWRAGFLDAAVYTGRPFDLEYFLNPIPQYFIQYFKATPGRPWATESNENNLLGLFWDINKESWDAYAQVLVDDFSLGFLRFLYDGFSRNPWKAAWALGGRINTSLGRFGFHHGGALKYTFEPIGVNGDGKYANDPAATAYGYTYYPETRYFDGDETVNLLIQDTMVGYKHGENNLAFQVDYRNRFFGFLVTTELELVLAGNNSPANPWHDYDERSSMYDDGRYGSQLFNDGQIETTLEFRVNVSRRFGPVSAYAAMALGGRFNKLELVPADPDPYRSAGRTVDNDIWIWKASDSHELIFRFSVGFRYTLPVL